MPRLRDRERHLRLVAGGLDALQAGAVDLDVARAVERRGDEPVPGLGRALLTSKVALGIVPDGEQPRAVDVDVIPEDVNLDGGVILVLSMLSEAPRYEKPPGKPAGRGLF